jgi:hypothetical protein
MSKNLIALFLKPLWASDRPLDEDHVRACVGLVFSLAVEHIGEQQAYDIFGNFGPPPKRTMQQRKNWDLLRRYDKMEPKPNADKLARELAAKGAGDEGSIARNLRRLLKDRREAMAAKTWNGPFPPGQTPDYLWGDILHDKKSD